MGYDKGQATAEFTRWSESYDRCILQWLLFGPTHRAIISRVRERFADRPLRILDVGCGTGLFAERIRAARPTSRVWGVDLVAGMLQRGRERWRRHDGHLVPVQGDSERLPFADASFDLVTCAHSFHHYPHQDRAVEEMYRVLKPGGRLMLADGYRDAPWGWLIYDVCVAGIEGDVHHASRQRMRELFSRAGFDSIVQRVHRGPAPFLLTEGLRAAPVVRTPHFERVAPREHAMAV